MRKAATFATVILLAGAAVVLGGCEPEIGAIETLVVEEPLASAAVTDVELVMGAGKLTLGHGSRGLVSGTIRCNVADWLAEIGRSDARLVIKQRSRDAVSGMTINDWDLLLGKSPMRLRISAGAYESTLDLSGLTLQDLDITEGAARALVTFDAVNPGQMERLRYQTGASTVTMVGLANANFRSMEFSGGAGTYSFDFSGLLRTRATARIVLGTGDVRIQAPETTAVTVKVVGARTEVRTQGPWVTKGSSHSTPAVDTAEDGKILTVILEMNVGTATLVIK